MKYLFLKFKKHVLKLVLEDTILMIRSLDMSQIDVFFITKQT